MGQWTNLFDHVDRMGGTAADLVVMETIKEAGANALAVGVDGMTQAEFERWEALRERSLKLREDERTGATIIAHLVSTIGSRRSSQPDPAKVSQLLAAGADPGQEGLQGYPLGWLIGDSPAYLDCAKALLAAGAPPDGPTGDWPTPLIYCAKKDCGAMAALLAAAGAKIEWPGCYGSPLSEAAKAGSRHALRALIAAGADLDMAPAPGEAAVDLAAKWGKFECFKELAEAGCDMASASASLAAKPSNWTHLDPGEKAAVKSGKSACAKWLKAKASAEAKAAKAAKI